MPFDEGAVPFGIGRPCGSCMGPRQLAQQPSPPIFECCPPLWPRRRNHSPPPSLCTFENFPLQRCAKNPPMCSPQLGQPDPPATLVGLSTCPCHQPPLQRRTTPLGASLSARLPVCKGKNEYSTRSGGSFLTKLPDTGPRTDSVTQRQFILVLQIQEVEEVQPWSGRGYRRGEKVGAPSHTHRMSRAGGKVSCGGKRISFSYPSAHI